MLDLYRTSMRLPPLVKNNALKGSISHGPGITLFQSSTYMNDSGRSIAKAFRDFRKTSPDGLLCVLHDEMESALGSIKVRERGKGKGHNGIRSCIQQLETEEFTRLAVGISRPESRESQVVTEWVLGRFTKAELHQLGEEALVKLVAAVERLARV